MRVLVVLDHPYTLSSAPDVPHERSFTAAVTAAAIEGLRDGGHEVDLIDLIADGFDPVMTREDLVAWRLRREYADPLTRDYQQRLAAAEHLVFSFPVWWEAMPASTKGFLDKVLARDVAWSELPRAKGNPFVNLLTTLRGVTVLTVMSTPHRMYRWWYGDPLTKILFKGTFDKIGVKNLRWRNYADIKDVGAAKRAAMLAETRAVFAALGSRSRR